jgi:acetylornithine deacetylase
MSASISKDLQDVLAKIISFDTTSRNSNLELIEWVQGYLGEYGIDCVLVPNEDASKANLYATIGPDDVPGIMLSGHSDVVPVDGQDWSTDPFTLRAEDGLLFGRGTCDMKGFIAVCLAYAPKFAEAYLKTPVHLAFSYDEEVTCAGAKRLAEALNGFPVKPRMCIVGEPTGMQVVTGHKGGFSYECTVRGFEAHSSLAPQGVNAIQYASELISFIRAIADDHQANGPFAEGYDVGFDTLQTGTINGGSALNIVPGECVLQFEFRLLPSTDKAALLKRITDFAHGDLEPRMKAVSADASIQIREYAAMPGFELDPGDDVISFVRSLAARNDDIKVAYQTEAGIFVQDAGIPSVICGPGHIAQAHRPDEYVSIEQLSLCCQFMDRLLERVRS